MTRPLLTLLTVTRNDIDGLRRTVASTTPHRGALLEHIVIDGASTDGTEEWLSAAAGNSVSAYVSRSDRGIYHAMNRGLRMAQGDWVLFLNSGDSLHERFSLEHFAAFAQDRRTAIVGMIELHWNGDSYVNPNVAKISKQLLSPPHQGFFAPRAHYGTATFDEGYPVSADRRWMTEAQDRFGTTFYPHLVARFELGGVSNRPSWRTVKLRAKEGARPLFNEAVKWCMYRALGMQRYYRVLYARKFTRSSGTGAVVTNDRS